MKGTTHLYLALILKMCGVIPSLPLRLHGAVLNEAQDKFYLIGLLYVKKLLILHYRCPFYRVLEHGAFIAWKASIHCVTFRVTAAVLWDTIKGTHIFHRYRLRTITTCIKRQMPEPQAIQSHREVFSFETSPWILRYS